MDRRPHSPYRHERDLTRKRLRHETEKWYNPFYHRAMTQLPTLPDRRNTMTINQSKSLRWTRMLATLILLGSVLAWAASVAASTHAATDPGRAAADYLRA